MGFLLEQVLLGIDLRGARRFGRLDTDWNHGILLGFISRKS
ncbi:MULTISPECIES: hypothetical protein [unclassified Arthrobacter]